MPVEADGGMTRGMGHLRQGLCLMTSVCRDEESLWQTNLISGTVIQVINMGVKVDVPSGSPFTIHNIPFGVISTEDNKTPRCASAIGEYAIDLSIYSRHGRLEGAGFGEASPASVFAEVRKPLVYPWCWALLTITDRAQCLCSPPSEHSASSPRAAHSGHHFW